MANQDEELFYYVGEVRTSSGESKGKLLFEMIVADQGLSILLKPKGDKKTYLIPLYLLIESFVNKALYFKYHDKIVGAKSLEDMEEIRFSIMEEESPYFSAVSQDLMIQMNNIKADVLCWISALYYYKV